MTRLLMLALAALAVIAPAAAETASAPIAVTDAWARATPTGATTGAAYVTVANHGTSADRLVSVSTPVAAMAQLHNTTNDNGVMKMRPVAGLDLKPGASFALKPGGYHVMLTGLKQPLAEGQSFPLTLTFEHAGPVETTVKIAKAGAMGGSDMGGMNMDMGKH
jgi:periplasmic copper chaperone A